MNEQTARIDVDRTGWAPGPWDGEPDRLEWRYQGVPCLMVRNRLGGWCGYAAVSPGHPWHGKRYSGTDNDYDSSPEKHVDVHGGLTYSDFCADHICHVPQPGESDNVYWFGFDCGHFDDVLPGMDAYLRQLPSHVEHEPFGSYKDVAYVRAEVERLAAQLLAVAR